MREFTRGKIEKISCPILIGHGDVHVIRKINYEIFMPELKRAGKKFELIVYAGEPHGFSNGRGTPAGALKFFRDSNRFFMRHMATKPVPLSGSRVKQVPVGR